MGRAESRKKAKYIKKRLTTDQFNKLERDINKQYIQDEVTRQTEVFKKLFSECLTEAFKQNNISLIKANMILDDVSIIMQRKVSEKRGEIEKRVSK